MNIGKWWLKHGPGSPGSLARAMVRAYRTIQARRPNLTHIQLLAESLESRYALAPRRLSVPIATRQKLLLEIHDDILLLILAVFLLENDVLGRTEIWEKSPLTVQMLTMEVILEAVSDLHPNPPLRWDAGLLLAWVQSFLLKFEINQSGPTT